MIDISKEPQESISEMMQQENTINEKDLNNLCYCFLELLEASLTIQWEIHKYAEGNGSMHLKILSEGFDKITKQCHSKFLDIKKKNNWDSNIGEEQQ